MFKKGILTLLTMILALTLVTGQDVNAASKFPDVNNYQDEIEYLTNKGIINGYPDGTFKPTQNLTRLQAVRMILREKGITDFTAPDPNFTDMKPGDNGYKEVAKAVELGFIGGKTAPNGSKYFDPAASLTRGQMSKILAEGYNLTKLKDVSFKDVPNGNGYKDYVSALASNNITTGYEDGTFKPSSKLSRQHFAAFMARMLDDKFKPFSPNQSMQVHYLDVGQGDATFIELATGKTLLVDAGPKAYGKKVVAYIKSLGYNKIDYVVATHPDADHIGGIIDVLNEFEVDTFFDSGKSHTTQTYINMLEAINKKNIKFVIPKLADVYEYDEKIESYFQFLYVNPDASDNNDASLVVKSGFCNQDIILMADASKQIENNIMNIYDNLEATILKVGHHGSNSSSSLKFLQKVNPDAVVFSYGKNNSYGHPHREVMNNIKSIGAKDYHTALDGTLVVTLDCNGYKIERSDFEFEIEIEKPGNPMDGDYVIPGVPSEFPNCTEMRKYYPNGVKKGHPAYEAKHDRDGDGWACEPSDNGTEVEPPVEKPDPKPEPEKPKPDPKPDYGSGLYVDPDAPTSFKNCTEMRRYYPNGVKKGHPAYASKHDGDKDGWACE